MGTRFLFDFVLWNISPTQEASFLCMPIYTRREEGRVLWPPPRVSGSQGQFLHLRVNSVNLKLLYSQGDTATLPMLLDNQGDDGD